MKSRLATPLLVVSLLSAVTAPPCRSDGVPDPVTGVYPPHSEVAGRTLADWSARWWQWSLSFPASRTPILDPIGELAHEGQSGPVFFLAGTYGGAAARTCTIPHGKRLFFPIYATGWIAEALETCDDAIRLAPEGADFRGPDNPGPDGVSLLRCVVDGNEVARVDEYAESSDCFSFWVGPDNVLDFEPGVYGPMASFGYWIMLAPPTVGGHTIEFQAVKGPISAPVFELNVSYSITIEEQPAPPAFFRGDSNGDGSVNLADAVHTLAHLFRGSAASACPDAADSNDDGTLNLTDAVHSLEFLFRGGFPPRPPGYDLCGEDPTEDALGECASNC